MQEERTGGEAAGNDGEGLGYEGRDGERGDRAGGDSSDGGDMSEEDEDGLSEDMVLLTMVRSRQTSWQSAGVEAAPKP